MKSTSPHSLAPGPSGGFGDATVQEGPTAEGAPRSWTERWNLWNLWNLWKLEDSWKTPFIQMASLLPYSLDLRDSSIGAE